jgi:hypothetical protein
MFTFAARFVGAGCGRSRGGIDGLKDLREKTIGRGPEGRRRDTGSLTHWHQEEEKVRKRMN